MNFVMRRTPIEVLGQYARKHSSENPLHSIPAICRVVAFGTAILISVPGTALSSGSESPRVVNVTSDSEPGWVPLEDLERQARAAATDYWAKMDSGKYADAYALLADPDRNDLPFSDFSDRASKFNAQAGAVVERRITTVTWTKNPAHAPLRGIYAALDLVSRFAKIDRDCGYLILYQAPSGGVFRVMREENNFLDNETAAKSTPAEVDSAWAKLSSYCPGYKLEANASPEPTRATSPAPLPEATGATIGYPTVSAALSALRSQPGVVFSVEDGWIVATDAATQTLWSFAPSGHAAYPAVVKRKVVERGRAVGIEMMVLCEATKAACDDLVRSFKQLNEQMKARMQSQR